MARVAGSYESVTRGVSQQVPQDRRPGQHWEQVNMLSDPVRGTARRHGSIMKAEKPFASSPTATQIAATAEDTKYFREYTFFVGGTEYSAVYRSRAKVADSTAPLLFAYNKNSPEFLPVQRPVTDAVLDQIEAGGVSAIINVGRYLFIAGNTVTTAATTNNVWESTANFRTASVWIRGGAYSRTFTASFRRANGTLVTASYKTMSSSYPGVLDTSGIAASDPEYQKKVNDATAAYNTAVTQWIGDAAADIQPENIAQKLAEAAVAGGLTTPGRIGAHVVLGAADNVVSVDVSDGGDGSFIRGVVGEVDSADELTQVHYAGKVVRVLPKKADETDAFYLKAVPKDDTVTSGFTEVIWREAAGVEYTFQTVFAVATVEAGVLHIAGSPALLATQTGLDVPQYVVNSTGDSNSSPLPEFVGRNINYLGVFQDRLVIGSGATLLMSRPGDYLNWWRSSVLTIEDDDPFEFFATAGADDTIRSSATYDRNLVLFGDRWQYSISGRTPITPITRNISVMSAHEDATKAHPVNSGNLVFFAKNRGRVSSLHQIQIGVVADSPEAFEVSQQLDTYLQGEPVEIAALTAPNTVLLRTDTQTNGVYVYTYLDTAAGAERLFDAWSKWTWNPVLGTVAGVATNDAGFLIFTVREGVTAAGTPSLFVVADRFSTEGALSDLPYLDSIRPASSYAAPGADTWLHALSPTATLDSTFVANDVNSEFRLMGAAYHMLDDLIADYTEDNLWVGIYSPAYVTPTNPFMKDRDGKAVLSGRLTLSTVLVSLADTGAMSASVEASNGTREVLHFVGRHVGASSSAVGKQPLVTRGVQFSVGREVRESKYTLSAIGWLPLTVTSLEWKGQNFNNSR